MRFSEDFKIGLIISNPVLGEIILDNLRELGFHNIWLESNHSRGYMTLNSESEFNTQMVITDVPVNGNEGNFLNEVRRIDRYSKVPILLLHSFEQGSVISKLSENGVTGNLQYPFEKKKLDQVLDVLYGKFIDKIPYRF